jgi:hypothetical protein
VKRNEILIGDSFCEPRAGLLAIETGTIPGGASKAAAGEAVATPALGKNGHLADCMAGPPDAAAICSQSWAPLRRQQDGKLESRLAAKATGAISEQLKEASSVSANVWRTR